MRAPILKRIADLLENAMPGIGSIKVYAFGSVLQKDTSANDIDLLIIYRTARQPPLVRTALTAIEDTLPLHLTFMLPEEEQETAFISSQGCVPLYWRSLDL